MTAAAMFLFGTVFGLLGCAWMLAPERRRLRHRATVSIRAAKKAMRQRNDAEDLLDGERSKNRALSAANERLYACLRDRMDEEEFAALQQGVSVFDRTLADFEAAAEIAALDELWEIS